MHGRYLKPLGCASSHTWRHSDWAASRQAPCLQVGEFAFVLLSLASQLGLISTHLSMLLLGVTAISLLTTPLVFTLAHHVLPRETAVCLPIASPSSSAIKRHTSLPPSSQGPCNMNVGSGSGGGSNNGANGFTASGRFNRSNSGHLRTRDPRRASSGTAECAESAGLSPWVGLEDGVADANGQNQRKDAIAAEQAQLLSARSTDSQRHRGECVHRAMHTDESSHGASSHVPTRQCSRHVAQVEGDAPQPEQQRQRANSNMARGPEARRQQAGARQRWWPWSAASDG